MAQSLDQIQSEEKLCAQFAAEAKKAKKDPARLFAELLRGYLDQQERERLNRETVAAMNTSLTEDDDIEGIFKDFRKKRLAKA